MSNFRYRVREATKILAVGEADVKHRLKQAITDHLLLANVPNDNEIPEYFRLKHKKILSDIDSMGVSYFKKRNKTISKIAENVWNLHSEFEEYLSNGIVPNTNN